MSLKTEFWEGLDRHPDYHSSVMSQVYFKFSSANATHSDHTVGMGMFERWYLRLGSWRALRCCVGVYRLTDREVCEWSAWAALQKNKGSAHSSNSGPECHRNLGNPLWTSMPILSHAHASELHKLHLLFCQAVSGFLKCDVGEGLFFQISTIVTVQYFLPEYHSNCEC